MATVSSEGSTGGGATSKFIHEVVGKPQVLVDLGTEGFLSSLTAGQTQPSISCCVSLSVEQRAALLAACFPRESDLRENEHPEWKL